MDFFYTNVIKAKLVTTIGGQEVESSSCYIQECVRICWLMCIKDPPLYIFYEKEQVFDKNHYKEYTEKGPRVSYVVWPALYLYKDGPMMRKGVAQGTGKRRKGKESSNIPNSGVNVPSDVICEEEATPGEPNQEMAQIDIHQMNQ
ncbi:hypothetical protein CHS0354_026302 [Potamilus streckersoni]|uniref:Mitochondria-eating protein n=1 Tax=Potamilus streckersoni TaxID=2493646 RepID=A0AAE0WB92_9BIVA|nr:hypothetical protein CHS0354_026302 [Potamilus streckersoni]